MGQNKAKSLRNTETGESGENEVELTRLDKTSGGESEKTATADGGNGGFWSKFAKLKTREFWLKVWEYSVPGLVACLIFLLAMIIKGIVPFGTKSLSIIDYNEGLVPAYTSLWDFLHGQTSFFATFELGAGVPMYASNIVNSFLSPISWLIGIFSRESVIFGVAFLLIVKFALMSTTAYICFKKFFSKTDKRILWLFSLIWTFSGWTMVHFTNIGWLDIMIILPLFILAWRELVQNGKILWFVITLSYMLILSYYISYMVLVGVVCIATVYYFTIAPHETRKRTASLLFWGIITSILISAVAFIPSCVTSLGAHRFADSGGTAGKEWLYDEIFSKIAVLLMQALPVLFFVKLMTTIRKDKPHVLFFLIAFCVCGVGILIEPINMMWHTGSYYSFPFRYSFILIMLMIFGALYYINKYYFDDTTSEIVAKNEKTSVNSLNSAKKSAKITQKTELATINCEKSKDDSAELGRSNGEVIFSSGTLLRSPIGYTVLVMSVILWVITLVIIVGFNLTLLPFNAMTFVMFLVFLLNFVSQIYVFIYCMSIKNKKLAFKRFAGGVLIAIVCFVQTVVMMIGCTGDRFTSGDMTARITNVFEIDTTEFDAGYKLKDADKRYNMNFGWLTRYPTLQTWVHISSEEQYQAYHYLGYNTDTTLLFSAGGTYLSDALMGNKYVLSYKKLDERYYTFVEKVKYFDEENKKTIALSLYCTNLAIKPAWTTNYDLTTFADKTTDIVENQNKLYQALYDRTDNIMDYTTFTSEVVAGKVVLTVDNVAGRNLYLVMDKTGLKIQEQGWVNTIYSGFNDMGISNDATRQFTLAFDEENDPNNISDALSLLKRVKFATFDVEKFYDVHNSTTNSDKVSLVTDKNEIKITVNNATNSKYLFVPYINLKNMKAVNNGQNVEVKNAIFNFMQLDITGGENTISLSNQPQLLVPCAVVTIVAIALFVLFACLNRRFKFSENKVITWVGFGGACVILCVVAVLVYVKPLISTFIAIFS